MVLPEKKIETYANSATNGDKMYSALKNMYQALNEIGFPTGESVSEQHHNRHFLLPGYEPPIMAIIKEGNRPFIVFQHFRDDGLPKELEELLEREGFIHLEFLLPTA